MKERPILFSTPMVEAILSGRKTMTRRAVSPLPTYEKGYWCSKGYVWKNFDSQLVDRSPYGLKGDLLWVREAWRITGILSDTPSRELSPAYKPELQYRADRDESYIDRYRQARFMPRWACRMTLEIVEVRAERLQKISGGDIINEGAVLRPHVDQFGRNPVSAFDGKVYMDLVSLWAAAWDKMNAHRGFSWANNPYVWVITFRRVT